jgi:hypothetical protein
LFFTREHEKRDESIAGAAQEKEGVDDTFGVWRVDEQRESPPEEADKDGE